MNYNFVGKKRNNTPQSKPISGREKDMKQNLAGGYVFKASDLQVLRRWLLMGSMSGAFYQGKEEMTEANMETLAKMISSDPELVGKEIIEASKKGVSVHTPIFALAIMSSCEGKAKIVFKEIFNSVIRTASHLYEFVSYVKDLRGFGSVIHKAVNGWLDGKKAKDLEYQFLKYQNRNGWENKDILRKFKPKVDTSTGNGLLKNSLYKWAVGKGFDDVKITSPDFNETFSLARIAGYERLKKGDLSEKEVVNMITDLELTHEMIPANVTRTKGIWEALFLKMPIEATIRNLGNLTEKGIFTKVSNMDVLEARLSKDALSKAYIHPIKFAAALMTYNGGGSLGKSKLEWKPISRVLDIMNDGIQNCFDTLQPTGKQFFYALDVSGSMTLNAVENLNLKAFQVAGILALASVKSEKNYFVGGFDTQFKVLDGINKRCSYGQIVNFHSGIWPRNFGGTDASSAYSYAIKNNIFADVFVFLTDNESWCGRQPSQVLKEYRSKINPKAKAIYVTLVPNRDKISLVDPNDKNSYDIAGFTSETPKVIQLIAKDEI